MYKLYQKIRGLNRLIASPYTSRSKSWELVLLRDQLQAQYNRLVFASYVRKEILKNGDKESRIERKRKL